MHSLGTLTYSAGSVSREVSANEKRARTMKPTVETGLPYRMRTFREKNEKQRPGSECETAEEKCGKETHDYGVYRGFRDC